MVTFSCVEKFEWYSTRFFPNLTRLFPTSCAPQCRNCHQIPHYNRGKHAQFWYLVLVTLSLRKKGSVPDRPRTFPLVPTCTVLPDLPWVELLSLMLGNTRCDSMLGRSITIHQRTSVMGYYHTRTSRGCCTSDSMPGTRMATECLSWPLDTVWWNSGLCSILPG